MCVKEREREREERGYPLNVIVQRGTHSTEVPEVADFPFKASLIGNGNSVVSDWSRHAPFWSLPWVYTDIRRHD